MSDLSQSSQRRFTVSEYFRMADAGILAPDERVELIRGTVREMSPRNRGHVVAVNKVAEQLRQVLGQETWKGPRSISNVVPKRLAAILRHSWIWLTCT